MDRKYFPERLQQHIASLEDSQGSLSDPEIDSPPTVGLDPPAQAGWAAGESADKTGYWRREPEFLIDFDS